MADTVPQNTGSGKGKGRARRPAGSGKPADAAYLERAALHYLERFATTRGHLAAVLRRKIRRRGLVAEATAEDAEGWIADLLNKLERLGYLDDDAYARARAATLLSRGKPLRAVRRALMEKAVDPTLIDTVLEDCVAEMPDPDLQAAIRYVRRRRLGPARPPRGTADPEAERRQGEKDMAALARAGFSYDIARRLLALEDAAALDDMEAELAAGIRPAG